MMRSLCVGLLTLLLGGLLCPAISSAASNNAASPVVHILLRESAAVQPDDDGFFLLGALANLAGGTAAGRARIASVRVGCVPLSGMTRLISHGDVALKLRQAGLDPEHGIIIEGVPHVTITLGAVSSGSVSVLKPNMPSVSGSAPPVAKTILIHRGDAVTITVQDDGLTITANGIAREEGAAGDAIRVHREGVMTDLTVIILDAHTVQLEI